MKTEVDVLMTHLIEELSEVTQEACKIQRFGLESYHPDEPDVQNYDRLRREIVDVLAMLYIIQTTQYITNITREEISLRAQEKLAWIRKETGRE